MGQSDEGVMSASSDSATSHQVFHVSKWSAEQTERTSRQLGIDPEALTQEHFAAMGFEPEEAIHIDQAQGTVTHTDAQGQIHTLTIEDWNRGS